MVGTPTLLGENVRTSDTNETTALDVTLSRAFAQGTLGVVAVTLHSSEATNNSVADPTISGGGMMWQLVYKVTPINSSSRSWTVFIFRAAATSPSGTQITITPALAVNVVSAQVVEVSGAKIGNNGADAFVQVAEGTTGSIGAGMGATAQLSTLSNTTENAVLAFGGYARQGEAIRTVYPDPTHSLVELSHLAGSTPNLNVGIVLHSQYIVGLSAANPAIGLAVSGGVNNTAILVTEIATEDGGGEPGGELTPGTATLGRVGPWMVEATATAASGGTGTVTMQWQRSLRGAGVWSNVPGQTTLTMRDRSVVAGVDYDYRLAYTDDNETVYSNTLNADVPVRPARWLVLGDSQCDEYKADDNRIDSGPLQGYVLNWTEIISGDAGQTYVATHHRDIDLGPWSNTSRGEPRRRGFERNLARSGAQLDDVVELQLPLAQTIINAGNADVAVLFMTGNEWGNPVQTPFLVDLIYNGDGTLDSTGTPVTTRMNTVFNYVDTIMTTLAPILPAGLVVGMVWDYAAIPPITSLYDDPVRLGYVSAAVDYLHGLIEARAAVINAEQGRTAVVTLPIDTLLKPDVWPTADGTYITVAGVELDYTTDSTDGSPYHMLVAAQTAVPHFGTILNCVTANTIFLGVNQLPGFSIAPFSDAEILEIVGLEAPEPEAQKARPANVLNAGSWETHMGSTQNVDLLAAINEETRNDSTFIRSATNPDGDVFEVTLDVIGAPQAGPQTLRYSYGKDADTGTQVNLLVEFLSPAGSVLDSWQHNNIPVGFTLAEQTIEASLSAGAYRVRFTATEA